MDVRPTHGATRNQLWRVNSGWKRRSRSYFRGKHSPKFLRSRYHGVEGLAWLESLILSSRLSTASGKVQSPYDLGVHLLGERLDRLG